MSSLRLALRFSAGLLAVAPGRGADPLPAPPDRAWVQRLFEPLRAPVPPRRLVGNIHYVGAIGVSAFLFTTPEGHILLDTGFDDTVPIIRRSVEQLGFKLTDIEFILSSHAHINHVGGHALMKKLTGAQIVASAADARTLESGGAADYIQWPKDSVAYVSVKADRIVADGERFSLGGRHAHRASHARTHARRDDVDDGRVRRWAHATRRILQQREHQPRHAAGEQSTLSGVRGRVRENLREAQGAAV
jgi:glyoxylase-like metal-dependent hydrolase (beta-lactamase superfamily II)